MKLNSYLTECVVSATLPGNFFIYICMCLCCLCLVGFYPYWTKRDDFPRRCGSAQGFSQLALCLLWRSFFFDDLKHFKDQVSIVWSFVAVIATSSRYILKLLPPSLSLSCQLATILDASSNFLVVGLFANSSIHTNYKMHCKASGLSTARQHRNTLVQDQDNISVTEIHHKLSSSR